jgi:hypothetical protein
LDRNGEDGGFFQGGSTLLALIFTPAAYRLLLCSKSKATVNVSMGALAPLPHG